MRKLIIGGMILLGALAFASFGEAATFQKNIWGASAQYQLYSETIPGLLTTTLGCPAANYSAGTTLYDDTGKSIWFKATGCTGGNTYIFDLNAKASYDGVLALEGSAHPQDKQNAHENYIFCDPATFSQANTTCLPGQAGDHCNYAYRVMTDPNGTVSLTFPCSTLFNNGATDSYCPNASGYSNAFNVACNQIDIALSDVNPSSFTQTTPGTVAGSSTSVAVPNGRNFPTYYADGVPTPGSANTYNPMVVPFGFFVHNDVTLSTCSGSYNHQLDGQQCSTLAECQVTGHVTGSEACNSAQLTNISRIQVLQIMSGQAVLWTDFGLGYGSGNGDQITLCARDAGSGTHATLTYGILREAAAGAPGIGNYFVGSWAPALTIYNDSTTPLMFCVSNTSGAIGYADADNALSTPSQGGTTYTGAVPMSYEGVYPNRRSIRNGVYDNFYSEEWVFESTTTPDYTANTTLWGNFMTAVSNGSALNSTTRANFWASLDEMVFMKSADYTYPTYIAPETVAP